MKSEKVSLLFPIALVFYEIATYLAIDMYLPSLPILTKELNISQEMAFYTLLFWFLGSASMQLIVGPLSDRFGRKIVLLIGGVLFILSTFINAFTDNMIIFILMRFIQGSTVCSVVVAGYAAVHELYDSKTAMKIIALMGSITILAPAFGPLFGALILEFAHWRAIFYLLSVWGIVSVVSLFFVMPETNPNRIKLNFNEIRKDYFLISTRKSFLYYVLPFCLLFVSIICWIVESPFIVVVTYHKTPLEYGIIQLLVFGSFIAGTQTTRILLNKMEPEPIINIGMLISLLVAVLLIASCLFESSHLGLIVFLMMGLCFGAAMAFGPLNRLAIDACSEPMGRRMAIFSTYMSLFGVFATILVTMFHDDTMKALSMMMAAGVILAFSLHRFSKTAEPAV